MALSVDSPRFSLRAREVASTDAALATTGHVVVEGLWDTDYLRAMRQDADARFTQDDERFASGFDGFPDSTVECYLGSFISLENLSETDTTANTAADKGFFSAFELTGLPGLLRVLLKGDFFVGRSERVIRRADPRFAIRFIGLHPDGQLSKTSVCFGAKAGTLRSIRRCLPRQVVLQNAWPAP